MNTLIVIPARYASKRFPAKPLHEIAGVAMFHRVAEIARRAAESDDSIGYVVATDHSSIETRARELNIPVIMTDPALPSGSDRALAAADAVAPEADFIINLQGDAPFTPPAYVSAIIAALRQTGADVATPVLRLPWDKLDELREKKKTTPFSGTTCVRNADGEALWFSKTILPAMRKEQELRETVSVSPVFRHVGLYGYTKDALSRFTALPEGRYETLEGLEQLRFLENGMRIMTVNVEAGPASMWGVDTPQDAMHAETLIAQYGDPMEG